MSPKHLLNGDITGYQTAGSGNIVIRTVSELIAQRLLGPLKAVKNTSERELATRIESDLTELEPNSKQKLKLANRELAFLEKKVRSLEKQLKSQGSDENKG